MCCAVVPTISSQKGWGWGNLWWLDTRAGCFPPPAAFSVSPSILQILSLFYMYCDMKWSKCNELRNHHYNFPMTVYPQHTFLASDLIIPTYICYSSATQNYYFSNTPSSFTPWVLAYTISCQWCHSCSTPATKTNTYYSSRFSSKVTYVNSSLRDLCYPLAPGRFIPLVQYLLQCNDSCFPP